MKGLLVVLGLAVLVGGGIWGFRYWTVGRFIQETNDAYVQAGTVAISPQVSGYVATVPAAANQIVTAGQVLATVNDGQYRAKLAQQQAQVDARQAAIARAEAELVLQQAQIDQAKAQVAASQVTARFSAEQVRRYKPVAASGADTVEKLDQYKSLAKQNQAQVQSAEKQVASLKAAVTQAKAAVDQAQAGVTQARLDLDHTVVTSPIAGHVGDLTARIGQYAAANAQVGQSVAKLFPKVQLLGNAGWISPNNGTLAASTYSVGPTLSWNILDFGRTLAQIRQSEAGTDKALAQYEQTVLQALQDAETALSRYGRQRVTVARLARASASAGKTSMLTDQRNTAGTISTIDVLDVERQRLQAEQGLAQAQAEYTNDYVALQKNLGLGWGLPDERMSVARR